MTPTAVTERAGSCTVSHVTCLRLGLVQPSVTVVSSPLLASVADLVVDQHVEGRSSRTTAPRRVSAEVSHVAWTQLQLLMKAAN